MVTIRNIKKFIRLAVLKNIYTRKQNINLGNAIFSFTFDDVPVSAKTNGASILEQIGATGTFYVTLGLEEMKYNGEHKYLNETDIKSLYYKGHDIACHTYSHLNLRKTDAQVVCTDCEKNKSRIMDTIGSASIDHFAYPFGQTSLSSKKELRGKYKTLRTTDPGLNVGLTDMTYLRAVSLCSRDFDRDAVLAAINEALEKKAWLIFFSHDICEQPSDWGLSVDDFQWVVDQSHQTPAELLNIKQAYDKISAVSF